MRVKSKNFLKIAFTLCCVLLLSTSCEKKYYTEDPTIIQFNSVTIQKSNWKWNQNKGRYEASFTFPQLTSYMYDEGVLGGSVFVVENGQEIQTPIPYVQTWDDGANVYTETLSFEVSLSKKIITYTLQSSDLDRDDYYLPEYEVKPSFTYY